MFFKLYPNKQGFTLIELLVAVVIIGLLATIVMISVKGARSKARDSMRVSTLRSFHDALELYYQDKGHYPVACGSGYYDFTYTKKNSNGVCGGAIGLRFDNSTSSGFMDELYPNYIGISDWTDPTNPPEGQHDNHYNCRYVIPSGEGDCADPDKPTCALNCRPQRYLLHCTVEIPFEASKNDGGNRDDAFEISEPNRWVCLTAIPN